MNQITLKDYCYNTSKRLMMGLASTCHVYPPMKPSAKNPQGFRGHYKPAAYNSRNVLTIKLKGIDPNYLAKIEGNLPELGMWAGLSKNTPIRVNYAGMNINIEIPKHKDFRKPVTIEELEALHLFKKGPITTLGLGMQDEPIRIDFRDKSLAHVFVVGQTGSGKTNSQLFMGWNIVRGNAPEEAQMLIIDVAKKGFDWDAFNGVANLIHPVIIDTEQAIAALKYILVEMQNRAANKIDSPKLFVLIDEVKSLIEDDPSITPMLGKIASDARQFGIHMILATQYPQIKILGDTSIKRNITVRLCGKVDDAIASSQVLGPDAGADKLAGKGDFLLKDLEEIRRLTVCKIEPNHILNLPRSEPKVISFEGLEVSNIPLPKAAEPATNIDAKALTIALFEDFGVNKIQEAIRKDGGSLSADRGMFTRKLAQEIRHWATELGYNCLE